MTSAYQNEQSETLGRLFQIIRSLDTDARDRLLGQCGAYLRFRRDVDVFLSGSFSDICTRRCYENRRSACCSREGIITFFADMVINVLCSDGSDIDDLLSILAGEAKPGKCIYLGDDGCLWRIKPIVCPFTQIQQSCPKFKNFDNQNLVAPAWGVKNRILQGITGTQGIDFNKNAGYPVCRVRRCRRS